MGHCHALPGSLSAISTAGDILSHSLCHVPPCFLPLASHHQGAAGKWAEPDPRAKLGEIKLLGLGSCWHCRCGAAGGSPSQHRAGGLACGAEPQSSLQSLGWLLRARGPARLVCTRQNAAPADTLALRAPGRFLWARHSLCQATTVPQPTHMLPCHIQGHMHAPGTAPQGTWDPELPPGVP